ncbi:hypothetical protein ACWDUL_21100 [Nocardia niigatensis]
MSDHLPSPVAVAHAALDHAQATAPATKPCGCPTDAESLCDGVIVAHLDSAPCGEPRRYVWQTCGNLTLGTLAKYAATWESYVYSGDQGDLGTELHTWDQKFQVTVKYLRTDEHDWQHHEISAGDERVHIRIDGRF